MGGTRTPRVISVDCIRLYSQLMSFEACLASPDVGFTTLKDLATNTGNAREEKTLAFTTLLLPSGREAHASCTLLSP